MEVNGSSIFFELLKMIIFFKLFRIYFGN